MRDIDAISDLGVPVYAQPGYKGGIYMDDSYRFDESFFTPEEVSDLVMAVHIAEKLRGSDRKNSILKKLELLMPELTLTKENDFSEYVKVDPVIRDFDLDDPVIRGINRGLDDEVWLDIISENRTLRAAPLYYFIGSGGISLCCTDGCGKLFFDISRISGCTVTGIEFDRDDFSEYL